MLDRVAVHQTRLRTPGLGLDAKGVALGAKGLVLLPSLDRLVAFLALFTRTSSLEDILRSLSVELVASKLGAREVTLSFASESSDRMDRVAEVARLAGGYTFTGTSRHFVQYRDAAAPFGYDVAEIQRTDSSLALYHSTFTQSYAPEREVELRTLLLRLSPQLDPSTARQGGARWVCVEHGLGPALIQYFVRSGVAATVGMAEWPPLSSFDDSPVRRFIFRVSDLPDRMTPLLSKTPGISLFVPVADGVGVEVGFRHPVNLRACPVFSSQGLVLFRGDDTVLELPKLPAMGDVTAFARIHLRDEAPARAKTGRKPDDISIQMRLLPTSEPWRSVTATWIGPAELKLLRRVAYALGPQTLRRASVAFVEDGAIVRHPTGIEAIPVGAFFREVYPGLYLPAGFEAVPAVAPEVLHGSLGSPADHVLFIRPDGTAVGVPAEAFGPLETALLEAQSWAPLDATALDALVETELPKLTLDGVGFRPMRDVEPADVHHLEESEEG